MAGAAAPTLDHDVALDFAQTVVLDGNRIARMYLLLAIHLPTRTAEVVGITEHPDAAFMAQCARNLTMLEVGFLERNGATAVLMDRDAIFTAEFRHLLRNAGFTVHRIPPRQPWCNGHVERFVQTFKNMALRKIVRCSIDALRRVTVEAIHHYNHERPHQGIGNQLITPPPTPPDTTKPIIRIDRLGDTIHHYQRAA